MTQVPTNIVTNHQPLHQRSPPPRQSARGTTGPRDRDSRQRWVGRVRVGREWAVVPWPYTPYIFLSFHLFILILTQNFVDDGRKSPLSGGFIRPSPFYICHSREHTRSLATLPAHAERWVRKCTRYGCVSCTVSKIVCFYFYLIICLDKTQNSYTTDRITHLRVGVSCSSPFCTGYPQEHIHTGCVLTLAPLRSRKHTRYGCVSCLAPKLHVFITILFIYLIRHKSL